MRSKVFFSLGSGGLESSCRSHSKENVTFLLSVKFGVKVASCLDTCEEKGYPTLLSGDCVKHFAIDCEELSTILAHALF